MSHKISSLYYMLWFAHPVLEVCIAALMVKRDLHRKFRYFFYYILTQIVEWTVIYLAYHYRYASDLPVYLYWGCQAVSVAFGFGVIHEVFVDVFRSFHTLRDLGTVLFKWAGLVMLLVAGVVSVSSPSTELPPWMQAIVTAQRCVRLIQVGMVVFLLFFAQYVGISRRQRSFGIALGFGWFAVMELALVASWVGNHLGNPWMSIANMIFYNSSLVIWFSYVALKSPARDMQSSLLQTQRWEQSLSDIHHPVAVNSLIPMFEGMVDRALSRHPDPAPAAAPAASEPGLQARRAAASTGTSSATPLPVTTRK
ncbi:MAG TPA: hypothetical protein VKV39_04130 [Candidatus Sulfotelmatobacter sp.]|nr:hypothetical protein [Candidatus Sulfotelmatobacter sp.]